MSYTEITLFGETGIAIETIGIENALRGALAIWAILEKKYLNEYIPDWAKELSKDFIKKHYENGFSRISESMTLETGRNGMKEIWKLVDNPKVSNVDKIVLASTFDHVLVKKEDFEELVKAFEAFEGETSLKEQARIIRDLPKNISAIGWNQTSVCQNKWIDYEWIECSDEEDSEYRSYNYKVDEEHYWLFDEI